MQSTQKINLGLFDPAQANPNEEVIARYTRGKGRFSDDKKYITLSMEMFDPDGTRDGTHEGVWRAKFKDPRELLARPNPPSRPLNQPQGPVQDIATRAQTKGIWTFGDGSSIIAVGDAMSSLVAQDDGSFLFMVATLQIISNGTGRYEGAWGLKTSLGSTHVPAGVDLFSGDVQDFDATTVDTFRVMRAEFVSPPGQ